MFGTFGFSGFGIGLRSGQAGGGTPPPTPGYIRTMAGDRLSLMRGGILTLAFDPTAAGAMAFLKDEDGAFLKDGVYFLIGDAA